MGGVTPPAYSWHAASKFNMSDEYEWKPPMLTEQEKLKMQAKQKEREQLSNAMGQYLLKGYRMLGSNCTHCGNILLRPPRGEIDFCINCQELGKEQSSSTKKDGDKPINPPTQLLKAHSSPDSPKTKRHAPRLHTSFVTQSEESIVSKLQWATNELSGTRSVDYSTQLCVLIREGVDALKSLKEYAHNSM